MTIIIPNYSSTTYQRRVLPEMSKGLFKLGQIVVNGNKIRIGSSLEGIANGINKTTEITKVSAKIKATDILELVIVSLKNKIDIYDPERLLLDLFNQNLIQIIGKDNSLVEINYSTGKIKPSSKQYLNLPIISEKHAEDIQNSDLVNSLNILNEDFSSTNATNDAKIAYKYAQEVQKTDYKTSATLSI
jgi:hypothetical protein